MENKILFITPHLSTGGLPKYLLYQIQNLIYKDNINIQNIFVIQYQNVSIKNIIQRNKIINLLNNNFFSINGSNNKMLEIINDIKPNIVYFEQFSETFIVDNNILQIIYNKKLNYNDYSIYQTTHGTFLDTFNKKYIPDKFILVNNIDYIFLQKYNKPIEVYEYIIPKNDNKQKIIYQKKLGLKHNKINILYVGLVYDGKNQQYLVNIAKYYPDYDFHFVGGLADNFIHYWKPLIDNKPDNCYFWDEREDVDSFYRSCDLYISTSLKQNNPINIKQALSYNLPILLYPFNRYDNIQTDYNLLYGEDIKNITFLTGDINKDKLIFEKSIHDIKHNILISINSHPNSELKQDILYKAGYNIKNNTIYNSVMSINYNNCDLNKFKSIFDNILFDKHNNLFINQSNKFDTHLFYRNPHIYLIYYINEIYHTYAVVQKMKQHIYFAKTKNYKYILYMQYDIIINNDIINIINEWIYKIQLYNKYGLFLNFQGHPNQKVFNMYQTNIFILKLQIFEELIYKLQNYLQNIKYKPYNMDTHYFQNNVYKFITSMYNQDKFIIDKLINYPYENINLFAINVNDVYLLKCDIDNTFVLSIGFLHFKYNTTYIYKIIKNGNIIIQDEFKTINNCFVLYLLQIDENDIYDIQIVKYTDMLQYLGRQYKTNHNLNNIDKNYIMNLNNQTIIYDSEIFNNHYIPYKLYN